MPTALPHAEQGVAHDQGSARPVELLGLAATGVLASAALGAITNMVNGAVSPTYFVNIMGWHDLNDVWRASVAQGILEGLVFGAVLSLIFTTVVGIVSKATCPYSRSVFYVFGIVGAALICWVVGGLIAIGLATLSPEFYQNAFIGVPGEKGEMFKYAWVGGSITGVQIGGFVSVILASVLFRAKWHH